MNLAHSWIVFALAVLWLYIVASLPRDPWSWYGGRVLDTLVVLSLVIVAVTGGYAVSVLWHATS